MSDSNVVALGYIRLDLAFGGAGPGAGIRVLEKLIRAIATCHSYEVAANVLGAGEEAKSDLARHVCSLGAVAVIVPMATHAVGLAEFLAGIPVDCEVITGCPPPRMSSGQEKVA